MKSGDPLFKYKDFSVTGDHHNHKIIGNHRVADAIWTTKLAVNATYGYSSIYITDVMSHFIFRAILYSVTWAGSIYHPSVSYSEKGITYENRGK